MKNESKKLMLNQETLKNLTTDEGEEFFAAPTTTVQTRFITCTCPVID